MGQDPEISALRSRRVWSRSGRAAHTGSATVMHSEQPLTIVKPVNGSLNSRPGLYVRVSFLQRSHLTGSRSI